MSDPLLTHTRSVTVDIHPLPNEGWGYEVAWENGGKQVGGVEDFPSAVTAVMHALREGQNHIAAHA